MHRSGVDESGDAVYFSAEAWWRVQGLFWENRMMAIRGWK